MPTCSVGRAGTRRGTGRPTGHEEKPMPEDDHAQRVATYAVDLARVAHPELFGEQYWHMAWFYVRSALEILERRISRGG